MIQRRGAEIFNAEAQRRRDAEIFNAETQRRRDAEFFVFRLFGRGS